MKNNSETWLRERFVRVDVNNALLRWLNEHQGRPEYQKNYWVDWNDAILAERVYIHWQLSK